MIFLKLFYKGNSPFIYMFDQPHHNKYNSFWAITISLLMFLLTANTLFPFPVDKVVVSLMTVWALPEIFKPTGIGKGNFILFTSFIIVLTLTFLANTRQFSFQIFLPLAGLIFSLYLSKSPFLFKCIYYASILHIFIGIILGVSSYLSGPNDYVSNLAYKGVPFLNSAMGFTPTPQTYGTLCLTWLVMYYFIRDNGKVSRLDKCMYIIATMGVFFAINRTSFLGYLLLIFFKERKIFIGFATVAFILTIIYWEILYKTLFNTATLTSRDELLEGFNKSFWGSRSIIVYLFGKADNKLADSVLRGVTWDFRNDIENGFAMILHMLGFTGLTFYLIATSAFLTKVIRRKFFYEASITVFFLYFSQYITQEFVATTYYIILGVLLYIYRYKNAIVNERQQMRYSAFTEISIS